MLRPMSVKRLCLAALSLALLAACGDSVAGQQDTISPAATPSYSPITPADACPSGEVVHLPQDYGEVTRAYVCKDETRRVPGEGEWSFRMVWGVTSGLDALLKAFAVPDETTPSTTACALAYHPPPVIFLRGEQPLAVRGPLGTCGFPMPEAARAHQALGLTELAAVKGRLIQSELSITSGCPYQYTDMLTDEERRGGPRAAWPTPKPIGGKQLCSYDLAKDIEGNPVGQLVAARTLTTDEQAAINTALARSTRDPSCARHGHQHFAMIPMVAHGTTTLIAVDGCAVQQDGGWWRATDRLRELVAP